MTHLEQLTTSGSSADHYVEATMTGSQFASVAISRTLIDPARQRELEVAVREAVNAAFAAHQREIADLLERAHQETAGNEVSLREASERLEVLIREFTR